MPTPGHTVGHQSLVVETRQGRVVLAGQAVNGATDFARAHFAQSLRDEGSDEEITVPTWIERIRELDSVEVLFAHDTASWHRGR